MPNKKPAPSKNNDDVTKLVKSAIVVAAAAGGQVGQLTRIAVAIQAAMAAGPPILQALAHVYSRKDGRSGFSPNASMGLSNVSPQVEQMEGALRSICTSMVGPNAADAHFAEAVGVPYEPCIVLSKIMYEHKRKHGTLKYDSNNGVTVEEALRKLEPSELPHFKQFCRRL